MVALKQVAVAAVALKTAGAAVGEGGGLGGGQQ